MAPLVLLATDDAQDRRYVSRALLYAHAHGWDVPTLAYCRLTDTRWRATIVQPTLIVIGDHTRLHWGHAQLALCRLLKEADMPRTSVALLYSGHRLRGRSALAAAAPDAVISTSLDEPLLFLTLYRLLVIQRDGRDQA